MILSAFVVLVYVVPILLLATARRAVLVRGERYAAAVLIFGAVDGLWSAAGAAAWSPGSVLFWLAHLSTLPAVRKRWILYGSDRAATEDLLESRMRMLMLNFERLASGYALPTADSRDSIRLWPLGRRSTILDLARDSRRKKVHMLRILVAKAHRTVYPRPVVQL